MSYFIRKVVRRPADMSYAERLRRSVNEVDDADLFQVRRSDNIIIKTFSSYDKAQDACDLMNGNGVMVFGGGADLYAR